MPRKWYEQTDAPRPGGPRRIPGLLILGLLMLLLALTGRWWLPLLARVLIVDQAPAPADAILVLGGGDGSREDRALGLYEQGLAPLVIASGEPPHLPGVSRTQAEYSADYMVSKGLRPEVIRLLKETTSTHDEAIASLQLAREEGLSSLIVVTDAFHTGRAHLAFRRVYRRSDIGLVIVAAVPPWFSTSSWWAEERSFLAVLDEYEKLLYYLLKGYIL